MEGHLPSDQAFFVVNFPNLFTPVAYPKRRLEWTQSLTNQSITKQMLIRSTLKSISLVRQIMFRVNEVPYWAGRLGTGTRSRQKCVIIK